MCFILACEERLNNRQQKVLTKADPFGQNGKRRKTKDTKQYKRKQSNTNHLQINTHHQQNVLRLPFFTRKKRFFKKMLPRIQIIPHEDPSHHHPGSKDQLPHVDSFCFPFLLF